MNRKLDLKKRIFKWQWCAWLLFSIILFFLNQMKVSIFYTVFYGIIVHFLITMIFTNSSLFSQFFYVILYSIYALLADVVSAMLPVVLFHENINRVLSEVAGSWTFIISMILFLVLWVVLNVYILEEADPYPFILLNLLLSCIAALQAPIIMMSQNREAKKDRLRSSNDYKTDLKSELILEELHNEMKKILANQNKILKYINEEKEK